jgi:hypothetical protein
VPSPVFARRVGQRWSRQANVTPRDPATRQECQELDASIGLGGQRPQHRPGVYEAKVVASKQRLTIGKASNLRMRVKQGLVKGKLHTRRGSASANRNRPPTSLSGGQKRIAHPAQRRNCTEGTSGTTGACPSTRNTREGLG